MKVKGISLILSAAAVLMTAGCAAQAQPLTSVTGIDELKTAFTDAGFDCSEWEQTNVVTAAKQSGNCGKSSVLSTYVTTEGRDEVRSNLAYLSKAVPVGDKHGIAYGDNWIVNSPDSKAFAEKVGASYEDLG